MMPCPFRLVMISDGMGYDGCANLILTNDTEFPIGIVPSGLVPWLQKHIDAWNARTDGSITILGGAEEQLIREDERQIYQKLVIAAIEKKIFRYPNCEESRTRNDVMHEVTDTIRELEQ